MIEKINQPDSEITTIRKYLHAHPELSAHEYQTANKVVEFISHYRPTSIIENVGGAGVLVVFDSGNPGATILFRAELDALPIHEVNDFEYRSTVKNISHKCGHDGHATILIGLAKRLSESPISNGKIILLFQPAEETGMGAAAVLRDPKFTGIKPDFVFALHNLPAYALHQVVVREGTFTASVVSLIIKLFGKTAHAAEPEHGKNPALAIASILKNMAAIENNRPEEPDFSVVTPVHVDMGSIDYGIAAGYGEVRLTLRAWTEEQLHLLTEKIEETVRTSAQAHSLKVDIKSTHHFMSNQNNSAALDVICQSALENQLSLFHRPYPFKWGEDFGLFTQKFKGAMFGIGAGVNAAALHNPDYDFPDELIPTGVNLFYTIASKISG